LSVEFYPSRRIKLRIISDHKALGETQKHDDYIDINGNATDGRSGRLTFEILPKLELTPVQILLELLLGKLRNNTITFEQLKTLIRLEHNFELTQTTRDKILIAVQGIVGTLRDRLKSAFGL